ncbi:MAG TPA: toll/interleukin-1 receptor domain-containing protein [Bryobacteraceae bacterium]|jgi:hypothetical protein|nr:toll/interleukin-1 receptor domain-containing protein [Bryobacteraceae bacterium]
MASKGGRPTQYRVFFSYSSRDRWIAQQCVSLIEGAGRRVIHAFLDEKDIDGGDPISETILKGIRQSDELVVLLSPSSKESKWVIAEMAMAFALRKRVVPILHHVEPKELPPINYPYKAIELNDFEQYLEQVLKRARAKQG